MTKDEEPIEIKILNEEPAPPKVARPEKPAGNSTLSSAAQKVGQAAQNAAQKAWESETRKKVTDKVSESAAKQKEAISEAVSQAVNERIDTEKERMKRKLRETDWKAVAKKGAAMGLKGISAGVGLLAKKLAPKDKAAADREAQSAAEDEQKPPP